jgi:hypothetical protein
MILIVKCTHSDAKIIERIKSILTLVHFEGANGKAGTYLHKKYDFRRLISSSANEKN